MFCLKSHGLVVGESALVDAVILHTTPALQPITQGLLFQLVQRGFNQIFDNRRRNRWCRRHIVCFIWTCIYHHIVLTGLTTHISLGCTLCHVQYGSIQKWVSMIIKDVISSGKAFCSAIWAVSMHAYKKQIRHIVIFSEWHPQQTIANCIVAECASASGAWSENRGRFRLLVLWQRHRLTATQSRLGQPSPASSAQTTRWLPGATPPCSCC